MKEHQKQIRYHLAAFLLLFSVSAYRQISLRDWPDDPVRTYLLWAVYMLLITALIVSIRLRVTQRSMRIFLTAEAVVMAAGLTLRFLQDTFLYKNILIMRISGFYMSATLLPCVLLGLYATLCTGRSDDYKVPKKWLSLLLPAALFTLLIVTDERRHFIWFIIPDEPQPNLNFHPYIGAFLLYAVLILLLLLRVLLIYRRSGALAGGRIRHLRIALFEPLLIVIFTFPFFAVSLRILPRLEGVEVLEFYAKLYYIEIITWELFIYTGLVPVNTHYQTLFEHAASGMMLVCDDGTLIISGAEESEDSSRIISGDGESEDGPAGSGDIFAHFIKTEDPERAQEIWNDLQQKGYAVTEPGHELHMHRLTGASFLWDKDVSALQQMIDELNRSAELLSQEGLMLQEELRTRNQEESLMARNRIYDDLTKEVAGQLKLMTEITRKQDPGDDGDMLIKRLYLLGTFVKRRCNLRLIERETGCISSEDLRLSFLDMTAALTLMGAEASVDWQFSEGLPAEASIYVFDLFENLLEYERFSLRKITVSASGKTVRFQIRKSAGNDTCIREETPALSDLPPVPAGCALQLESGGDSYAVILKGGGV